MLALCVLGGMSAGCGCGGKDDGGDGLTDKQSETGDRMAGIIKDADGSWDKVPEADKKYLLGLSNGNEHAAKMRFEMMSSRILGTAGPTMPGPGGGRPGGAPPTGG